MRSGLYHSVVSNCQVDHNHCLLQYSLGLWSFNFLHIRSRALFDLHQTSNLDSNDRKFHCDPPLEYDFEQCTVAMYSSILSAILLEGILKANHLFSSQQFLVDHLHSKGIYNKMHRQWFLHVIGQVVECLLTKHCFVLPNRTPDQVWNAIPYDWSINIWL